MSGSFLYYYVLSLISYILNLKSFYQLPIIFKDLPKYSLMQ